MKGSSNADLALVLGLLGAAAAADGAAEAAAAWRARPAKMQKCSAKRLQPCRRRSHLKHVSSSGKHTAAAVRGGGLGWFTEDIEVFPEDLDYGEGADGSSSAAGLPAAPQSLLSSPRSPPKRSSAGSSSSSSGTDRAPERNTALVSPAVQPRRQQQQQQQRSKQQSEGSFFQRRGSSSSAARAPSLQQQHSARPASSPLLQDRLPAVGKGEPVALTPVRTPLHEGLVDALTDGGKPLLVCIWGALLGGVALRGWDMLRRRSTRSAGLLTDSSSSSSGSISSSSSSSSDGSSELSPQQLQDQLAAYERDRARAVALVRDLKAARRRDADAYKEHMQVMQAHIDTLTLAKGELESSIAARVREGLAGAVEAAKQSGAEDAKEEARAEVIVLQQQVGLQS
jgi:hypothetical protein